MIRHRYLKSTSLALLFSGGCAVSSADPPPAPLDIVGVIEGFYGQPWSHQDRLDMVRFMGSVGLSDYIYAPKDDPYHLSQWRDPYPADDIRDLGELADSSRAHGVRLWYAISPGGSIRHADDEDYRVLMAKIDAVAALGIEHFGLFVDDVDADLRHDSDRDRFANLAEAHVFLTNRLHADLAARGARLIFTPTTYTNAWGDRGYARTVGEGIHQDVPIVWTGMDVASPQINQTHAAEWAELINRPPLLWDNYPVNDFAPWRVFLGPVAGRSDRLTGALSGLVSNPMNQAHASMIALHTLATYVRDPLMYDPAAALDSSIEALFGPAAPHVTPLLAAFGSYAWDDHVFEPLYFPRDTVDLAPISAALRDASAALDSLNVEPSPFVAAFVSEVRPVVERLQTRLSEVETRPGYRSEGTRLVFDGNESIRADTFTPVLDGALTEWRGSAHRLHGSASAEARLAADADFLYLAVSVISDRTTVRSGPELPEGDHVQIVHKTSTGPLVAGTDHFVLVSAPDQSGRSTASIQTMRIDGFMTKWFQDNERLVFNSFHQTNMADAAPDSGIRWASGVTGDGYVVEVALPRSAAVESISIQVSDRSGGPRSVSSLSPRNFPFAPETYVDVQIVENR